METKLAAINHQNNRLDKIALAAHGQIESVRQAIAILVDEPTQEAATAMDAEFTKLNSVVDAYRNSLITLANILVSDDGTVEDIDVIIREDGSFEL